MTRTIYSPAVSWIPPSVAEVDGVMKAAAQKLNCKTPDLHRHFHADARTFRRWKENADTAPDKKSTIKYSAWGLLVAIAENRLIFTDDGKPLQPKNEVMWRFITENYIYTADNFERPSAKLVSLFIGKDDSISGLNKTQLAEFLGYNQAHFGRLIGAMNFGVWSSLLLCYGVPVSSMFKAS